MKRAMFLMVAVAGCADEPVESTGTNEAYAIAYNAIAYNQITTNAIAANRIATDELVAMPLAANHGPSATGGSTGTFASAAVRLGLEDPNAKTFMEYLVQCALQPDQQITWTSYSGLENLTFTGSYGLCPTWYTTTPTAECRQKVSGCILARNNAFGYSVQFSLRGMGPSGPMPLASSVTPHNKLPQTKPAQPVASLESCTASLLGDRDCSWVADKVGICSPGETVEVGAGAVAQCGFGEALGAQGSAMEMLRVCPGHTACDAWNAIEPILDCATFQPQIKFTCPAEGIYSVMQANYRSIRRPYGVVGSTTTESCRSMEEDVLQILPGCSVWSETCEAELQKMCHYPAPERRVFRWLEGSFYGDIFGSANLNPYKPEVVIGFSKKKYLTKPLIYTRYHDGPTFYVDVADGGAGSSEFIGVVFKSMYACSSPNWENGRAYMERRVCAGPRPYVTNEYEENAYTRDCAAKYVGPCRAPFEYTANNPWVPTLCEEYAGLGKEHLAKCRDTFYGPVRWNWPISSALADRRDAIPDPIASQPAPGAPFTTW